MARRVIPVVWTTCKHCGKRYDEGNALAHFAHRNRDCLRRAALEYAGDGSDRRAPESEPDTKGAEG